MVKRIIRRNNYNQYEKTHAQCIAQGLIVNRPALDRFADKLQLIDRAELSRRQGDIKEIERAQRKAEHNRHIAQPARRTSPPPPTRASRRELPRSEPEGNPLLAPVPDRLAQPQIKSGASKPHREMTYEEVKKRETEITFELGEIRIRESELLQELITLSEMLEKNQFN